MPKARLLYEDGLSAGRIAKILSMSKATVYRWIANFAEEKENNMSAKKESAKKVIATSAEIQEWAMHTKGTNIETPSVASIKPESAEEKIARLEKELREARLRADFYDEMINVAEKKFDIQIRKKAGARQ